MGNQYRSPYMAVARPGSKSGESKKLKGKAALAGIGFFGPTTPIAGNADSPLAETKTKAPTLEDRFTNLDSSEFVSREVLINRYPNLVNATRGTEGELPSTASCVRLVKAGYLKMPKGFPPDGRGYWLLSESAAWHDRKFPSNTISIKQRQPRHG